MSDFFSSGKTVLIYSGLIITLATSAACVNQDDPLLTAPVNFTTTIYDNGIKQFQLQLAYEIKKNNKQRNESLNGKKMSDIAQKRTEAALVKRLDMTLQETHYCREGYILLKEFSTLSLGDLLIKGECVEGASSEDKRMFPNKPTH